MTIAPFWETEEHIRPVWKLYWNRGSGASLDFKGNEFPLKKDELTLISPLTHYIPHCPETIEHFYIHFRLPDRFARLPRGIWSIGRAPWSWEELVIPALEQSDNYTVQMRIFSLVGYALSLLPSTLFEEEQHSPLEQVFHWLERHIAEDCGNKRLSAVSGYSADTLTRHFRKETGMSPQAYIRQLRISKAAVLLRQTTLGIDEIAEACGFYDRAHFHKAFKSRTTHTPVDFRKAGQT